MEKAFKNWLENIYPEISERKIKDSKKFAKSYINGIKNFADRKNIKNFFEIEPILLNDLLNDFDDNTVFASNDKSHLKRFVEFKELDPNQYHVFNKKENEKKSKKTENTAVKDIIKHFTDQDFKVKRVEKDNCGWDLEATKLNETLLLEVKGLSGKFYTVNLSENEYQKLKRLDKKEQKNYRVCVVTNCLSEKSKRDMIFLTYNGTEFLTDKSITLEQEEIISLRLRSEISRKRTKK